jgi:tetratricopeptide (TPR) repeat protein
LDRISPSKYLDLEMTGAKIRMRHRNGPRLQLGLTIVFLLVVLSPAQAATPRACENEVARLVSAQGVLESRAAGAVAWQPASLNETFCPGDMLRTGVRSRAAVVLVNETIVRLDQRTTLTFSGVEHKNASWLDLVSGVAHFISRVPRSLKVKTPYVNAAIEGTEFVVRADRDEGSITVLEGQVLAENAQGAVRLVSGESAVARDGQAPVQRLVVHPREAVQWSLYYPPLFDSSALIGNADWVESARRSAAAYLAGDSTRAFEAIASVPGTVADARFFNYRAGLLLSVGRLDEAEADIARSLGLAAGNAHATALQSVVALARNDKIAALDLARRANASDPESAPAWIALSYAQQAAFDIEGARASVEQALIREPNQPLALARLSELWLSLGDLDRALETANRAVALNPDIARTQTVLGFAYLTQIKTAEAKQAFEKAITLDSADPLPRLGLGLAIIRMGDLQNGRREIEIAASLDPNNALIRSYLGKAYYDEKRGKLAESQLTTARQLDPNDPTPYFYDAIRKQSENRPVEALQDLQKSIELNDNRAVYRSRLLLDQDIAARSASLGRIYNDLGFQKLALAQGWRSINSDPGDYSGHRLLADNYASLQGQDIARVSELLKAQLLQPVNLAPIQPQLAETSLAIQDGAGPTSSAYNEFNPLFIRDRAVLQLDGVRGSRDTRGGDVILSGLQRGLSWSLGQFTYQSDGFRPNNDQDQTINDFFVQVAPSSNLSLQAERRSRTMDNGDLALNFDPDNFSRVDRGHRRWDTDRLGLHYAPTRESDVLVSWISADLNTAQSWQELMPTVDEQTANRGHQTEAQYLWRGSRANLTAGLGSYDIQVDTHQDFDYSAIFFTPCPVFPPPFQSPICSSQSNSRQKHDMAYVYSNIVYPQDFTWTIGASRDAMEDDSLKIRKLNPKLGLQWSVTPGTEFRLAYLETVKRTLLVNQTIEPTQVAGFNQFFDEINGTHATLRGVGLDSTLTKDLYGGIEGTRRVAVVPQTSSASSAIGFEQDAQRTYRSYLYWAPSTQWALSAEIQSENMENASRTNGPASIDALTVPLGARYFSTSGVFGKLMGTYVQQTLDLRPVAPVASAREEFFLVDAALGYRLPRRLGTVNLEVKNIFNRKFSHQDQSFLSSEPVNPVYLPERQYFFRLALVF